MKISTPGQSIIVGTAVLPHDLVSDLPDFMVPNLFLINLVLGRSCVAALGDCKIIFSAIADSSKYGEDRTISLLVIDIEVLFSGYYGSYTFRGEPGLVAWFLLRFSFGYKTLNPRRI